ncbi:MAG TPA: DUF5666 domain-containing protein [Gammaproteobacteria bacterium]|nr:DUF5666 domain-containing protein [Gammaproteobacteria bacterium]
MANFNRSRNSIPAIAALSSVLLASALPTANAFGFEGESSLGTSTNGIVGTGIEGIAGTGIEGIAGTGIEGIAGTGIEGIAGTGIEGIAGTGIEGIAGTGIEGIAGTGIEGIAGTGIEGIAGTGIEGIAGTGIEGIAGTGIEGIAGTGIEGIAGTGIEGIAGTGIEGIAGTGIEGIAGTGIEGIAGTGIEGIAGTGIEGIAGTGIEGIAGTGIEGTASSANHNASQFPLVAYGPIEAVLDNGYLVLGQTVTIANETSSPSLKVGDTAIVLGLVSENGILADRVLRSQEMIVDGSSLIYVAGIVDAVDPSLGNFHIGGLSVHLGAAGADPKSLAIESGHYVEVFGVRFDQLVIADQLDAVGPFEY